MSVNGITNAVSTTANYKTTETKSNEAKTNESTTPIVANDVIYEAGSNTSKESGIYEPPTSKAKNEALIAKLKADVDARTSQLRSLVEKMMTDQGSTIGKADSMWNFLAKGDFTVDALTKENAQADIAEDGYWGVTQTSDRMFDFAKALAGDDPEKMEEMKEAFIKGFEQATKTWGGKLPDISQRTYDATLEKFDNWANESDDSMTDKTPIVETA